MGRLGSFQPVMVVIVHLVAKHCSVIDVPPVLGTWMCSNLRLP